MIVIHVDSMEDTARLKKAYAGLEHVKLLRRVVCSYVVDRDVKMHFRPANYEEIITSRIKEILIQALARVSGRPRSVVWKEPPA